MADGRLLSMVPFCKTHPMDRIAFVGLLLYLWWHTVVGLPVAAKDGNHLPEQLSADFDGLRVGLPLFHHFHLDDLFFYVFHSEN